MSDNENPYEATSTSCPPDKEADPAPSTAEAAVRDACRYAIPVMSVGWVLLTVEFYFSNSHRMSPVPAALAAVFQALTFAGIGLGVWLGCAALVGALRR